MAMTPAGHSSSAIVAPIANALPDAQVQLGLALAIGVLTGRWTLEDLDPPPSRRLREVNLARAWILKHPSEWETLCKHYQEISHA